MSPPLPALIVDAASPVVSVQVWTEANVGQPAAWQFDALADAGLFNGIETALEISGLGITDFRSFVYCEGPGSILGIRTVAIAFRTWGAIRHGAPAEFHAYRSLELVAADLLACGQAAPFSIVSDARRESWHILKVGANGTRSPIRRAPAGEISPTVDSLFHPSPFPVWQERPAPVREAPYRPERLRELSTSHPWLLRRVSLPDAFVTDAPVYRKWVQPLAVSTSEQP